MISKHLEEIQNVLDLLSRKIRQWLPMGDYDLGGNETSMYDFYQVYRITNLVKTEEANAGVLQKKSFHKNLANFTGKHLRRSLFLIKLLT